MIKSYRSKRIKDYCENGVVGKIDARHIKAIRGIISALGSAVSLDDCDLPGKRLHPLKQYDPVRWSLDVSANWRITFEWDGSNVYQVDYENVHP